MGNDKPPPNQAKKPPPHGKGLISRRIAVEVLVKVHNNGAYTNLALANALNKSGLSVRDRAFVTALVQGVIRRQAILDERIETFSKHPLSKMPPALLNVLRIAVFQLEEMKDIPQSAVLNTSNDLARLTGHEGLARFVNGLLRNYQRNYSQVPESTQELLDAPSLCRHYSMPQWLVDKWLNTWGLEETIQLLDHTQAIPELTVRTCQLSITPAGLAEIFKNHGIKFRQGVLVPSCLILESGGKRQGSIEKLPGYKEGLFIVQDEAAAFVSAVAAVTPGQLVIDLCAAPGGKSLHMAELMDNKGRVVAVDPSFSRLNLLKQSRQRLGLTNIEVAVADGRTFLSSMLADCVLIDAPCTGTGVINRRSDLRLNRQAPDVMQLQQLQRELLSNAINLVKPGGILVYSTCSIEQEENEDNLRWFLEKYQNFVPDSLCPYIPDELLTSWQQAHSSFNPEAGFIQLMPSRHGTSGFFIARLRKIS